jgi:predicted P-loop ATPase
MSVPSARIRQQEKFDAALTAWQRKPEEIRGAKPMWKDYANTPVEPAEIGVTNNSDFDPAAMARVAARAAAISKILEANRLARGKAVREGTPTPATFPEDTVETAVETAMARLNGGQLPSAGQIALDALAILTGQVANDNAGDCEYLDRSVDLEAFSIPLAVFPTQYRVLPQELVCDGWSEFIADIAPADAPIIKEKGDVPYVITGTLKEAPLSPAAEGELRGVSKESVIEERKAGAAPQIGKARDNDHLNLLGPPVLMDDDVTAGNGDVFDREAKLKELGIAGLIYSSHSYGFGKMGGRVAVCLNRTYTPDEHKPLWHGLNHLLGGRFDAQGDQPSRCYGAHVRRSEEAKSNRIVVPGAALNADALIALGRTLVPARKTAANGSANTDVGKFLSPEALAGKPSDRFKGLNIEPLNEGLKTEHWFDKLTLEYKDDFVRRALRAISTGTVPVEDPDKPNGPVIHAKLFELKEHGGGGYRAFLNLVFSIVATGAPHAEDYFVEFASQAKGADSEDKLREKFHECKQSARGEVKISTLIYYAQEAGLDLSPQARADYGWSTPTAKVSKAPVSDASKGKPSEKKTSGADSSDQFTADFSHAFKPEEKGSNAGESKAESSEAESSNAATSFTLDWTKVRADWKVTDLPEDAPLTAKLMLAHKGGVRDLGEDLQKQKLINRGLTSWSQATRVLAHSLHRVGFTPEQMAEVLSAQVPCNQYITKQGGDRATIEKIIERAQAPTAGSGDGSWPDGTHEESGRPKKGLLNTIEAIARIGITCTQDDFRRMAYWSGHVDHSFDGPISDPAIAVARRNIALAYRLTPAVEDMHSAVVCASHDNRTNPVLEYFARLKWDGVQRLATWLIDYLGADDTPLNRAYAVKFFCAIVRRAKQPGCKFDGRLDLQGEQDVGKSMFCKDLAVFPDIYTDAGNLSLESKQMAEIGQGRSIIEFPENKGHSAAMREHNKATITRQIERARMAYDRYATDSPRTWVPIATLNKGGYLNDPTGERRYWNVFVRHYAGKTREAFLAVKDQLYAEAVALEPGMNLWLDTPELKAAHDAISKRAKEPNEMVELLSELTGYVWRVDGHCEERVSVAAIRPHLGLQKADACRMHGIGKRIAEAMMHLGWAKADNPIHCHKQGTPGPKVTGYARPLEEAEALERLEAEAAKAPLLAKIDAMKA